ncbi:hypothetical protein [Bradyrhizobium sp. USDA 3311]
MRKIRNTLSTMSAQAHPTRCGYLRHCSGHDPLWGEGAADMEVFAQGKAVAAIPSGAWSSSNDMISRVLTRSIRWHSSKPSDAL